MFFPIVWRRSRRRFGSWLRALGLAALLLGVTAPLRADVVVVGTTAKSRAAAADQHAYSSQAETAQLDALQRYIGEKYRVPVHAVRTVVESAWEVGQSRQLDPLLLLAVMAIESSFNPKAKSHKGAQGLMQVMTRIHRDRFEAHGGLQAALKPAVNIDVGAQILQECIDRRGSVAGGLTCYVGAPGQNSRYGNKVLAEFERLQAVVATEVEDRAVPAATQVAQGDPALGGTRLASNTRPATDLDDVIEAPPISRMAESDAPHLARSLLLDLPLAVDL